MVGDAQNPDCDLQYAGNVVVYGGISPCDGDWFGGVTADNSLFFLEALLQAEAS